MSRCWSAVLGWFHHRLLDDRSIAAHYGQVLAIRIRTATLRAIWILDDLLVRQKIASGSRGWLTTSPRYLDNLYSYLIDNYRQLLHKTILNTSGPKRRNKKADKKKPAKKADPNEPLPETPFTLEMELQHNLIRGLLRVSICMRTRSFPKEFVTRRSGSDFKAKFNDETWIFSECETKY